MKYRKDYSGNDFIVFANLEASCLDFMVPSQVYLRHISGSSKLSNKDWWQQKWQLEIQVAPAHRLNMSIMEYTVMCMLKFTTLSNEVWGYNKCCISI